MMTLEVYNAARPTEEWLLLLASPYCMPDAALAPNKKAKLGLYPKEGSTAKPAGIAVAVSGFFFKICLKTSDISFSCTSLLITFKPSYADDCL